MTDIFNQELSVNDYILYSSNSNLQIGKIHHFKNNKIFVVSYSSYYYIEISNISCILSNENQILMRNDGRAILNNIERNEIAIIQNELEAIKTKENKLAKKKELQKNCVPGRIYCGECYNTIYLYLGRDENKNYIYSRIKHVYIRHANNSYGYVYKLSLNQNELIIRSKSKKLPTSEVKKDDYNISNMITTLEDNIRTISGGNNYVTINDINEFREIYNKAVL